MIDARVPMAPILAAFGVAITVTPPQPSDGPVSTTGVWAASPLQESSPYGVELGRRDPRKVLSVPRTADLQTLPIASLISAPEIDGDEPTLWRVELTERTDPDLFRVIVVPVSDVL